MLCYPVAAEFVSRTKKQLRFMVIIVYTQWSQYKELSLFSCLLDHNRHFMRGREGEMMYISDDYGYTCEAATAKNCIFGFLHDDS